MASLLTVAGIEAGQVVWSSERLATNVTSTGTELGTEFRFELGSFEKGFEPAVENIGDWRAHWVTVGQADYNAAAGFFAASSEVTALPGEVARTAFIWGFNRASATSGAEWVLLTNPDWVLPVGKDVIAPPENWSTGTASIAVVGSVNATPGIHLQTDAVGGAVTQSHAGAWLSSHGLGSIVDSHLWEMDSDGDGVSNLLEYAAGTHPLRAASVSRASVYVAAYEGDRALTLTFDKNPEARVHYHIEISSDLNQWEPADDVVEVVSDTADQVSIRDAQPFDFSTARYFRLRVVLQP